MREIVSSYTWRTFASVTLFRDQFSVCDQFDGQGLNCRSCPNKNKSFLLSKSFFYNHAKKLAEIYFFKKKGNRRKVDDTVNPLGSVREWMNGTKWDGMNVQPAAQLNSFVISYIIAQQIRTMSCSNRLRHFGSTIFCFRFCQNMTL